MTTSTHTKKKNITLIVVITLLFFFWGLANNMTGTLMNNFGELIEMTNIQSSFIKSAFYFAYFFIALPTVYYIYKSSYKNALIIGLIVYAAGTMLFYPASNMNSYCFFLLAIYVMAAGCTMLETVANPYIISSTPDISRGIYLLNFAQSFNPLGAILGILLCNNLILDVSAATNATESNPEILREELDSITVLYACLGEILLIFMVILMFTRIHSRNNIAICNTPSSFFASIKRLSKNQKFIYGTITMFLYMGAQVGTWDYTIPTIKNEEGFTEDDATLIYIISMSTFAICRFGFTFAMRIFNYRKLLNIVSLLAMILSLVVVFVGDIYGIISLVGISGCMSMMFATIYGMALSNTGQDMQTGGGILVMMISGGALFIPIQRAVANALSPQMSYIVPTLCFMAVYLYSIGMGLMDESKK